MIISWTEISSAHQEIGSAHLSIKCRFVLILVHKLSINDDFLFEELFSYQTCQHVDKTSENVPYRRASCRFSECRVRSKRKYVHKTHWIAGVHITPNFRNGCHATINTIGLMLKFWNSGKGQGPPKKVHNLTPINLSNISRRFMNVTA